MRVWQGVADNILLNWKVGASKYIYKMLNKERKEMRKRMAQPIYLCRYY